VLLDMPMDQTKGNTTMKEGMMTTDARVSIARACYEAYVAKDRAAIESLLAEDFHFTSPFDNRLDRATYFARCWPNSQQIQGFEFIHLVAEGDNVFVTYEGRRTGGHRFRNTEIVTVKGPQVIESLGLFRLVGPA
jgi:hypothetical protein